MIHINGTGYCTESGAQKAVDQLQAELEKRTESLKIALDYQEKDNAEIERLKEALGISCCLVALMDQKKREYWTEDMLSAIRDAVKCSIMVVQNLQKRFASRALKGEPHD